MPKYILLIIAFVLTGWGSLFAQTEKIPTPTVTMELRNVALADILKELEKQTGIVFSYESSLLAGLPKASLSARDESLAYCLKRLFAPLPVSYKETGNYIILKKKPRQYTISGFVQDKESQECLINATIFEQRLLKGATSNNYGFFSLTLPAGNITLRTSYVGFKNEQITFELKSDTLVHIELSTLKGLQEVVVQGTISHSEILNSRTSSMELSSRNIQSAPAVFGEADLIKLLQQTPGVATGTEALTGMYVRGGNGDENLYMIDGNPVYHVNHLMGLFSTFNPDAVKNLDFYKGSFPARYGGRLSSVIDVRMKDGDMNQYHGNISVGLLSARANIEGPIIKDKTSFNVSFRRTYLDMFTAPIQAIYNKKVTDESDKTKLGYSFYDLNAKINHIFSDRSRIHLNFYMGQDRYRYALGNWEETTDKDMKWRWGNLVTSANWNYVFNNKLFANIALSYSRYKSIIREKNTLFQYIKYPERKRIGEQNSIYSSSIEDWGYRLDFDYLPHPAHHIKFGSDYLFHIYHPETNRIHTTYIDSLLSQQQGTTYSNQQIAGHEWSAYAEDDWIISERWKVNLGLRMGIFQVQNKGYFSLQPRVSARYLITKNFSAKVSYAKMEQYIHLLSNSYLNLPTDIWVPVTAKIKPMNSHQVTAGLYYNLNKTFDFSVESYYKTMNNLIDYQDGHTIFPAYAQWDDKVSMGKGRAYGVEFMARKDVGKTTGWIGYTLSWSDRYFPDGTVNQGKRFPAKYDNRHKVNISIAHKLSKKVELSAAWTYATGNNISIATDGYFTTDAGTSPYTYIGYGNGYGYGYENQLYYHPVMSRNAAKLDDYHRLDLGVNFYRYKKKGRLGIWNVSIYNVYCRMNAFGASSSVYMRDGKYYIKQKSLLPVIPSVSYTYKF